MVLVRASPVPAFRHARLAVLRVIRIGGHGPAPVRGEMTFPAASYAVVLVRAARVPAASVMPVWRFRAS